MRKPYLVLMNILTENDKNRAQYDIRGDVAQPIQRITGNFNQYRGQQRSLKEVEHNECPLEKH